MFSEMNTHMHTHTHIYIILISQYIFSLALFVIMHSVVERNPKLTCCFFRNVTLFESYPHQDQNGLK